MKRVLVAALAAISMLVCVGTAAAAGLTVSAPGSFSNAHPQPGSSFTARYCGATAQPTCASIGLTGTVAGEAGVAWGNPAGGSGQSALTWLGASSLATSYDAPFLIGRLTHRNFPITNAIDSVQLTYNLSVSDGATQLFQSSVPVTINVDETPNTPPCPYPSGTTPCSDRISWTVPASSSVIPASSAGGPYVLNILGFRDAADSTSPLVSDFISQENSQNDAYLFASLNGVGTGNAADDSYTTVEDQPLSASVLLNDTTPAQVTSVSAQTSPAHGTLTFGSVGDFTYTPAAGYTGPDSFIYLSHYSDGSLALAKASIDVQPDTTKPTLASSGDIGGVEATGPGGATVSWPDVTATDPDDAPGAVTCAPASGSTFPLGPTTVNCSSTDTHGNTGTTSFVVTVVDTTKPSITCPAGLIVEATGPDGANVVPSAATASDLVSTPTITGPAAGTYPLGGTTVTYVATDAAGNSSSCTSTITVVDTTPPTVHASGNVSAEATSSAGAVVSWPAATASDLVGLGGPVTCDHASGDTYPLGATTVTCTAKDTSNNKGTASFVVTVVDTTAPAITVPSTINVNTSSLAGATVTYTVTASDLVDGSVTPTCSPASGATFAIGSTTVNCSATDAHGNTGHASFVVNVNSPAAMLNDLWLAANLPPGKSLPQKVKNAQAAYAAHDIPTTCSILAAFISEVSAQSGKQLTVAQATDLLGRARAIRTVLGC